MNLLGTFFVTALLAISVKSNLISPQTNSKCNITEFLCDNRNCIPLSAQCDGKDDCKDNSDEIDCDLIKCRPPNYFKCANERCISYSFVCDGENDCEDFSDELNCTNFKLNKAAVTCKEDQWKCTDNLCIPKEWVCNGQSDCLDGSDELLGCTVGLHCDGFRCENGHCIFSHWRCDGQDDCHDNSDEKNCPNKQKVEECNIDSCMCANQMECIKRSQICDGRNDCLDKSDEGLFCKNHNSFANQLQCSRQCVLQISGPKCLCGVGYNGTDSNNKCKDIDECSIYGICDQKCENTEGSYKCTCEEDYVLQDDKRTCKTASGDATLVFSSKNEIRAFLLKSKRYISVAKNLKQAVGVDYDGYHVFWTDIFTEHESLVKAQIDGTSKEMLVTSGLGAPEDLKIDHYTNNIYFTDAERQHIAVCNSEGFSCMILVEENVNKPRSIVLHPEGGDMFWSDWGKTPQIAHSFMDGSDHNPFIVENIHWPNGLTIDHPNHRLYWTDAKLSTLESINLDSTDRRVVLAGAVKHPYSIAVFEDRLYWSDWTTHSIQSCHKFTGKQHETIITENKEFIYGISIYHSSLRRASSNHSCASSICSDICLLKGENSYTCGCPEDKILGIDRHTCKYNGVRQKLMISVKNMLVKIEHRMFGKHDIKKIYVPINNIGAIAYNKNQDVVYIADNTNHKIYSLDMNDEELKSENIDDFDKIVAMEYDHVGHNLFYCDSDKDTVEVISLTTLSRKTLFYGLGIETPVDIALIPEEGIMFVALKQIGKHETHIDRLQMDGLSRLKVIQHGLAGPVNIIYDSLLKRIFIADGGTGNIESTSVEGDDRHGFLWLQTSPIAVAALKNDVFWINKASRTLYWAEKLNSEMSYIKQIKLDIPNFENLKLIAMNADQSGVDPCHHESGDCSDICLYVNKSSICVCSNGLLLNSDNRTCTKRKECASNEFLCSLSNVCLSLHKRCDGHIDCEHGEDEAECNNQKEIEDCSNSSDKNKNCTTTTSIQKATCPSGQFACDDGNCIQSIFVCDTSNDCPNGEDEENCLIERCKENEFRCQSGACLPKGWECDGEYDCLDFSDEHKFCDVCSGDSFRCNNERCISQDLVCNDQDDCGDRSDESNCSSTSTHFSQANNQCEADEFACSSDPSICLPKSALCNNTSECPHHEDEQNCSNCHVDEFTCKNRVCIPQQWICDKSNDCGDLSDEDPTLCAHNHGDPSHDSNNTFGVDLFRCKNNQYVDFALVCDGVANCADASDENGACNNSCTKNNNPCSHICQKTPNGAKCNCHNGYILNRDNKTCDDINECDILNPCSQICNNFAGYYECNCFEGFILKKDKHTCKALGLPLRIFYIHGTEIEEYPHFKVSHKLYKKQVPLKITGFETDIATGSIFYATEFSPTIHRINLFNDKYHYINISGQATILAFDWITENIYYVNENYNSKSIDVCNFNLHPVCITLIEIDPNHFITTLIVDPINRLLIYSESHIGVRNNSNVPYYQIKKTSLDGQDSSTIIDNSVGYISGLTYDLLKREIFYTDRYNGALNQVNYIGNNSRELLKNIEEPRALHFFEDFLYFIVNDRFMYKCKTFDFNSTCNIHQLEIEPTDFILYQESLQPFIDNPCVEANCKYICIPGKDRVECPCEEEIKEEGIGNCILKKGNLPGSYALNKYESGAVYQDYGNSNGRAILMGVLLVIFLVFAAWLGYIILLRRNKGKFYVGMRFQNPIFGMNVEDMEEVKLNPKQHEFENPINIYKNNNTSAQNTLNSE